MSSSKQATNTKSTSSGAPLLSWDSGSECIDTRFATCAATDAHISSLKNHGVYQEAERMFDMGMATLELPLEEKMQYEQGDSGASFG